ncbi:hypothetical protein [Sphingomonas sanxanigenens]|uniref:Uncharacterized protein n=1 Tax=Sphingomonas sanxanigenens DSM 19645 = NX02 TaxID=1123269 RepID=W0A8K3_9SPHN|nr:hypothetical protein [Sphingomonas sanxanigenens]AHE52822.1 hypothetical protein NX02_05415 [Sphingomonas sanxanigenens DSM 19645 = NX02]
MSDWRRVTEIPQDVITPGGGIGGGLPGAQPMPQRGMMFPSVSPDVIDQPAPAPQAGRGMFFSAPSSIAPSGPANIDMPNVRRIKPGFFQKGGTGQKIAEILGPALLGFAAGDNPVYGQILLERMRQKRAEADYSRERADRLADRDDERNWKANEKRYFQSGEDYWQFDPITGTSSRVADAPSAGEEYASAMGFDPDTDDYRDAIRDYILRGSGPTATGNDLLIEEARQGNREALEALRQRNRLQTRGTPTWRQQNPEPRSPRATRNAGGSGSGRRTATGPGGKKVEWDGSRWVPVN